MLERIRPGLVSGAVVLAHDGLGPGALRGDCAETVELIPRVAALAEARGLRLCALEDAAESERVSADGSGRVGAAA